MAPGSPRSARLRSHYDVPTGTGKEAEMKWRKLQHKVLWSAVLDQEQVAGRG